MAESSNARIYRLWMTIQDVLGDAAQWPMNIKRLFWTRGIRQWGRTMLAAFVWTNGLNPEILFEWIDALQLCRDGSGVQHFRALFRMFTEGRYSRSLYAWDLTNRRYEYLVFSATVILIFICAYIFQVLNVTADGWFGFVLSTVQLSS
ncbi:hypothetical protein BaRGS_00018089 [Batillaria attramentaria]|uniref:Uncharacterized protein n=1 Tax=Batillaria attramentaria TaxID=370345 RepID=A0ABD0KUB7_9CAEN